MYLVQDIIIMNLLHLQLRHNLNQKNINFLENLVKDLNIVKPKSLVQEITKQLI